MPRDDYRDHARAVGRRRIDGGGRLRADSKRDLARTESGLSGLEYYGLAASRDRGDSRTAGRLHPVGICMGGVGIGRSREGVESTAFVPGSCMTVEAPYERNEGYGEFQ